MSLAEPGPLGPKVHFTGVAGGEMGIVGADPHCITSTAFAAR